MLNRPFLIIFLHLSYKILAFGSSDNHYGLRGHQSDRRGQSDINLSRSRAHRLLHRDDVGEIGAEGGLITRRPLAAAM